MCKKKVMWLYAVLQERLRKDKDPWDRIGYKSIQHIVCWLCHVPKEYSHKVIKELEALKIIERMGKNQEGILYKVN